MTDDRLTLIAWKVNRTTEIQAEMAGDGRTSELLWARDCKMLLDHISALEQQRAAAERRAAELVQAGAALLADLDGQPNWAAEWGPNDSLVEALREAVRK